MSVGDLDTRLYDLQEASLPEQRMPPLGAAPSAQPRVAHVVGLGATEVLLLPGYQRESYQAAEHFNVFHYCGMTLSQTLWNLLTQLPVTPDVGCGKNAWRGSSECLRHQHPPPPERFLLTSLRLGRSATSP